MILYGTVAYHICSGAMYVFMRCETLHIAILRHCTYTYMRCETLQLGISGQYMYFSGVNCYKLRFLGNVMYVSVVKHYT